MSTELTSTSKLREFVEELKKLNIEIINPSINESFPDFRALDGKIYYGLGAIKNVGFEAISNIVNEREKNGKFKSLTDFIKRVNEKESELFFMKSGEKRHNIFGLWSVNLVDQLNKDLEIGTRKVERWANDIGVKIINMAYEKQDPFFNINTKEDLEIAEKILDD